MQYKIMGGLLILSTVAMIYTFGFTTGYHNGYKDSAEYRKQLDCEFQFGNKPQSQIIGDCLKFFKTK